MTAVSEEVSYTFQAIAEGLTPILCIGESKAEYDAGLNQEVCANQLSKDLEGIAREDVEKIVIACKKSEHTSLLSHALLQMNRYGP